MTLEIIKVASQYDYARSIQIRMFVFVIEQNVPADREIDALEDECTHFLALWDGIPAAAVRWRKDGEVGAKLERLAVRKEFRGKKIGAALTQKVLDDVGENPQIKWIKLGSQDHAIPFYEQFAFAIVGDGYDDGGGIPHHDMVCYLNAA